MRCDRNGGVDMASRNFSVLVNEQEANTTPDGNATPDSLGMNSYETTQLELCSTIELNEGENTISISIALSLTL